MIDKKSIIRNKEKPVQKFRFYVQSAMAILCLWIGVEFFFFVKYLQAEGNAVFINRPPGVEGFLPISSMMSFYISIKTGVIHHAHPAGMFIFAAILLISLVFGKAFCSWLCPVGFLSELIGDFGERVWKKLFKRKLTLPKYIDIPLRSLKYLLLGFFIYAIFFLMTDAAIITFLDSPYNLVADLKMFNFFAELSGFALTALTVLFVLSIFIRNFWCRYLCPYGALLGLFSFLSPNKIVRNKVSCINCGLCTKACPSLIKVDKASVVLSDECSSCLNCVDVCPVADTLNVKNIIVKKTVPKKAIAVIIVVLFMLITGIGMITGNWQNDIPKEHYIIHYERMNSYGHPTGTKEVNEFNKEVMDKNK